MILSRTKFFYQQNCSKKRGGNKKPSPSFSSLFFRILMILLSLFFFGQKRPLLSFSFFIWSCANSRRLPLIALKSLHISLILLHWRIPELIENFFLYYTKYQITTVFSFYPKGSQNSTYSHNLSSRMFALCLTASRSRLVPNDISVYPSRDPSLLSRYWLILSDDGKEGSSSQQVWLRRERSICYGWCGRPRILLNIDHLDFLVPESRRTKLWNKSLS